LHKKIYNVIYFKFQNLKVFSTEDFGVFEVEHINNFLYEIGKEAIENNADEYRKGLHFTTLEFIGNCEGNTILECEVAHEDILTVQDGIIRARKCRVIRAL